MQFRRIKAPRRQRGRATVQGCLHAELEAEDVVIADCSGPRISLLFLCYFSVRLCYFWQNRWFYASFC